MWWSKWKEEMEKNEACFGDERAGNFVNCKEAAKQGEQGVSKVCFVWVHVLHS